MVDQALHEVRMRLLERVAETVDELGVHRPTLLAQNASTQAEQDAVMGGLEDLERAGLLSRRLEMSAADDRWSISPAGHNALQERERLRKDWRAFNRACRLAVAGWLYDVRHRGEPHGGSWSHFTEDEGNYWLGRPFPEVAIDNASQWLHEQGFIEGWTAWQLTRIGSPSLTAAGDQWLEEQQSDTGTPSAPSPTLEHMAGGYKINKRAIAKMTQEIQREFNKHPIQMPVESRFPSGVEESLTSARDDLQSRLTAPATTTIYNGPVFNMTGDRAQLAVGNDSVVQTQGPVQQQIAPGFEAIAAAVALTLRSLPAAGLPAEDAELAETAATEVLEEVVKEAPDPGLVRRGVTALRGVLGPLAMGLQEGAGEASRKWARTAVEQLGQTFGL